MDGWRAQGRHVSPAPPSLWGRIMYHVGDKFLARRTSRNALNGIDPLDDIRTGFVDDRMISIHVIKRTGKTLQLVLSRQDFAQNFENDRFHLAPPNRGYAMARHAMTPYR
ncbi:MAG: hypothetical protein NTX28_11120 [Novosphingobium sp.]|nr:hypothetical protein [Novosphingobium sp.]